MANEKKPTSTISNHPEAVAVKIRSGRGKKATGVKLPGTDKKFIREFSGQEATIIEKDPVIADPEAVVTVQDEISKHKYPPPRNHPIFRKIWAEFIDNVCSRENFKVGHLNSLEILCDLYVEYDDLRAFLRTNGRSYKSISRAGQIHKLYPEVTQLNIVQSNIKEYMKMLGLLLKKDHSTESGGEKDNWE
jgi:hypothetical protein